MANFLYNIAKTNLFNGTINWNTDTFKAMLINSGYTPNPVNNYVADVIPATNELNGVGYSRLILTGNTIGNVINLSKLSTNDLVWSAINAGTTTGLIIFKFVSTDTDSILICYIDSFGFPVVTSGSDLELIISSNGLINL